MSNPKPTTNQINETSKRFTKLSNDLNIKFLKKSRKFVLDTVVSIGNGKNVKIEPFDSTIASYIIRGGSRTAATSKMERFVIIVNSFQPLTIITKRSILDVAEVLDPPLIIIYCDKLPFGILSPYHHINIETLIYCIANVIK